MACHEADRRRVRSRKHGRASRRLPRQGLDRYTVPGRTRWLGPSCPRHLARREDARSDSSEALLSSRRDEIVRTVALPNLAAGRWELAPFTWKLTTKLSLLVPGASFSVDLFFGEAVHLMMWYVNFERPFQRTRIGIDTFDLLLDLVVDPDTSHHWKDEEEYAQARRLGIITDDEHRHVQQAREHVLALLDAKTGPFDERWRSWRRDLYWQLPTLPVDATTVPAPQSDQVRPIGMHHETGPMPRQM